MKDRNEAYQLHAKLKEEKQISSDFFEKAINNTDKIEKKESAILVEVEPKKSVKPIILVKETEDAFIFLDDSKEIIEKLVSDGKLNLTKKIEYVSHEEAEKYGTRLIRKNEPHLSELLPNLIDNYENYGLSKKEQNTVIYPIRTTPKIGRNEPCPCGSGKKNKNCCKKF